MPEPLAFDPEYYFSLVARNLLKNLGEKALPYTDHALNKMKALGDDEGLSMWLSIHEHLTAKMMQDIRPDSSLLH